MVQAVDALVGRFDDPAGTSGGLTTQDVKDILREAGTSADKLAVLVRASDALVASGAWDDAAAGADRLAAATVDRILWGGAGIVLLLLAGLALLRLVPQRVGRG